MSKLYNQLQPVISRLDNKINNVKEQLQDIRQELADIESDWGSSIIDDTLSIKGAAADAKAVGDYHMTNIQAADLLTMGMSNDILGDKNSILYNQLKPVVSQLDDRINNIDAQIEDLTQNITDIKSGISTDNVFLSSGYSLTNALGNIDISKGTVQKQIDNKINTDQLSDYVDNKITNDVTDWLDENVTETGSAIMVDASLSIRGAAADAKATSNKITNILLQKYITIPFGNFSVGGLNSNTGQANNPTWRCRTDMAITTKRMAVFLDNPAYTLTINLYSELNNRNSFTISPTGGYTDASQPIIFNCSPSDKYYMIAINRIDQQIMTTDLTDPTSDWSIIKQQLKVYNFDTRINSSQDVLKNLHCKTAKEFDRYIDSEGRPYILQGLCVTPKYVVFSCNSEATTEHPNDKDVFNAIYILDKETLELADLPQNPIIIDFSSGDYPITKSHANSMTYYPDDNEIWIRQQNQGSYRYRALDADTFAIKRFDTLPLSGGFAYDQSGQHWCFLHYTSSVDFNIYIYDKNRENVLTQLTPKRQGIIQGIGFFDNMVFIPASGSKGNSIIATDIYNNVIASWWFDGLGEFEDIDKLTDNTLIIGANDGEKYKLYIGAYKVFNKYYGQIKNWELPYETDSELALIGVPADAKATGTSIRQLNEHLSEYENIFTGNIDQSVQNWLTQHPESSSMIQDGTITERKLSSSLKSAIKDSVLNMAAIDMRNSSTNGLGDCTVFYGDVNGIVDFGTDPNVPDLLSFLTTNSITKIDFVIISHYHGDHVTSNFATALGTLVNGGIDFSECVFYLPHKGINWSRFVGTDNQSAKETIVKNALTNNNFTYIEPNNGQTVVLTPYSSISFYNIGDYDEYYDCYVDGRGGTTNFTIYNNFSMISVLNHCGSIFVLSGDIHELAQSKNYQYIERCDVYKVEHHGANSLVDSTWMARIIPQFIIVEQATKNSYNTVEKLVSPIRKYCDRGAKLLFTGSGTSTIQSKGGALFQKTGGCFDLSLNASLGGGIPIYKNSDLNDYTEIGEYYCLLNNTVATLSNCPTTSAFRLVVENPRGADSGSTLYRLQRMNVIVSNTEYRRYITITDGVASFSDWTPELITLIPYSDGANYFTDSGNTKVIKNGSMCIVRLEGNIIASTTGWTTIFTGAPKSAKGETLPANLLTNSGTLIRARVTSYGNLQIHVPVASIDTNIGTTFVYISQ